MRQNTSNFTTPFLIALSRKPHQRDKAAIEKKLLQFHDTPNDIFKKYMIFKLIEMFGHVEIFGEHEIFTIMSKVTESREKAVQKSEYKQLFS